MAQIEMFEDEPRGARFRETANFHASVVFLRRQGCQVTRVSGRQSMIDGSLIDNHALVRFARWLKEGKK